MTLHCRLKMNGCYAYNSMLRNFRYCYRNCNESSERTLDLKRRLSLSARIYATSDKRFYSFKSVLEVDTRKQLWDVFKFHLNEKLVLLGEIVTNQCNFIASQRIRRMSQMWSLYNQLYSEKMVRNMVSQLVRSLRSKRRPLSVLFGASLFCWETEKITDEEIINYRKLDEILLDGMHPLRNDNYTCISELDRYRGSDDHPTDPISGGKLVDHLLQEGWENVIKKECIQVWRKAFPNSYLYEYKIMGTFYDVPARTFFAVQTDIEYRKKWDKLVIKLDEIDRELEEGGCEVMHWIMHYPYPMYGREYVYIRRAVICPDTNTMVLVSRSTEHPSCPVTNKYVRVSQYSSRMVIRPHRTYDENGFDYVLTYFDDPQAAFPTPAYNWMASSGVPDFVEKLHNAARDLYHQERKNKPVQSVQKPTKDSIVEHSSCTARNNYEYLYM